MDATLRYTLLGFEAVRLLDRGETLDIDETRKRGADETLFDWLKATFGDIDLSLYEDTDRAEVSERLATLSNAADSRREFGVERNGLALIAAWCFEMVQELHLS